MCFVHFVYHVFSTSRVSPMLTQILPGVLCAKWSGFIVSSLSPKYITAICIVHFVFHYRLIIRLGEEKKKYSCVYKNMSFTKIYCSFQNLSQIVQDEKT